VTSTYVKALICVLVIASGQVLFKVASGLIDPRDPLANPKGLGVLFFALAIYGAATLLWIAILRQAPLSRIYPFMALSFVVVPLASFFFLKEQISLSYWGGVALIVAGIVFIGRSELG
jgi:drug/metabolite transporter (DMT)-like permease